MKTVELSGLARCGSPGNGSGYCNRVGNLNAEGTVPDLGFPSSTIRRASIVKWRVSASVIVQIEATLARGGKGQMGPEVWE
jgi:hypothetical protein